MNGNKLKGKIISKGFNMNDFIKVSGIKKSAFYRKLNGKTEFVCSEIMSMAMVLELSAEETCDIFFEQKVS